MPCLCSLGSGCQDRYTQTSRWCSRAQPPPAEDTESHLGLAVTQCPSIPFNIQLGVPSVGPAHTSCYWEGEAAEMQLGGITRDSLGGKGHGSLRLTAGTIAMDGLMRATRILCFLSLCGVVSSQLRPLFSWVVAVCGGGTPESGGSLLPSLTNLRTMWGLKMS